MCISGYIVKHKLFEKKKRKGFYIPGLQRISQGVPFLGFRDALSSRHLDQFRQFFRQKHANEKRGLDTRTISRKFDIFKINFLNIFIK